MDLMTSAAAASVDVTSATADEVTGSRDGVSPNTASESVRSPAS